MNDQMIGKKPIALNEWTYDFLKQKIFNLEFRPGDRINIEELMETMGISRSPLSHALLRLANENLVDIRPHVGHFVSSITEQDVQDIFEIRQLIESRAVARAIKNLSDIELKKMKMKILDCEREVKNGNLENFVDVDIEFHSFLHQQVQNRLLSEFMQDMNDLTYRIRVISLQSIENIELSFKEHLKILDSLIARNEELSIKYINDHLQKTTERMVSLVKGVNEEN